jgi:hypothetical protein
MTVAKQKMNRAQRRTFARTMNRMRDEAQGVYRLTIITPPVMLEMLAIPPAEASEEVVRLIGVASNFLHRIETLRPTALCLLCDNELVPMAPPRSFTVLTAHRDTPQNASVSGICALCSRDDLKDRVFAKYRENNLDLRMLPPPSAAGHA